MPPKCFKCGIDVSLGDVAIWDNGDFLWVRDSTSQWQNCTGKWTKLPNAIWSLAHLTIEDCNVYCKSCWKNWAQFVKPGRKYALSRSCEEMAIKVGIQFIPNFKGNKHSGNPFYCSQCHSYSNHHPTSLEKHLVNLHGHTVAVKRKQRDEFEEPILFVSGCSHSEVVSSTIKGKYTAKRWHHGKPVYEKDKADKLPQITPEPVTVLIYFWNDRLEPEMSGWWFAPREGGSQVWAHHADCDLGCLTVPKAGWKAPWDGKVDTALTITTEEIKESNQTNQTQTDQASQLRSDLELRWEFLVSDESDEEWQLMSKEMNDALEKRWAQGWDGDNGTDDFYVQFNGHTYGIDCYCFVQWNLKTGRRRRIRRGEPRPSPKSLQAQIVEKDTQMVEKDAQLKEVQSEKQSVLNENANLNLLCVKYSAENATLKSTVARLEKEKAALEGSMADHGAQMKSQEPWRMNRQLETKICTELNHWDAAFDIIRQALVEACPQDHFGNCNRMRHVSITGLQQICNTTIWKAYEFKRDQVRKDLEGREGVLSVVSNLPSRV